MKIYLAARYSRFPEMARVAMKLNQLGHLVTSRWINGSHKLDDGEKPDSGVGLAKAQAFAKEDMDDVAAADTVVSFTEPERTATRGGRHAEFGAALALGKRLIIVGTREHIFHYLPQIEIYPSLTHLLVALAEQEPMQVLFENEIPSAAVSAIKGR